MLTRFTKITKISNNVFYFQTKNVQMHITERQETRRSESRCIKVGLTHNLLIISIIIRRNSSSDGSGHFLTNDYQI